MKKVYLIFAFIFLILISSAKDWDLFPVGKKMYYEISPFAPENVIETLDTDSNRISNDTILIVFKRNSLPSKCQSSNYEGFLDNNSILMQADTGYIVNDTTFLLYDDFDFKFYTAAQPGDHWDIKNHEYSLTCDSISEISILEETDSVKYFTLTNTFLPLHYYPFILSKIHGLTQFTPFHLLIPTSSAPPKKVELIGYKNQTQNVGRTIPEFSDFFHLHTGDVLYGHYIEDAFLQLSYYYKDSITNTIHTEDSVVYEVTRESYSGTENKTSVYRKSYFLPFLNASQNNYCFTNGNPFDNYNSDEEIHFWNTNQLIINDSISSLSFGWYGQGFYIPDCEPIQIMDTGYSFKMNTTCGITEYCSLGWGTRCYTVVGSIINDEATGLTNVDIKTGGVDFPKPEQIQIYPNPNSGKLYHNIYTNLHLKYKILNIQGQVILSGKIDNTYIDISRIPAGIYELVINDKIRKKIVKINPY